jgi:hypothetical protein
MLVEVAYSVRLRNGRETAGKLKAKTGDLLQELMYRILEREGFKNKDSFILDHNTLKVCIPPRSLPPLRAASPSGSAVLHVRLPRLSAATASSKRPLWIRIMKIRNFWRGSRSNHRRSAGRC